MDENKVFDSENEETIEKTENIAVEASAPGKEDTVEACEILTETADEANNEESDETYHLSADEIPEKETVVEPVPRTEVYINRANQAGTPATEPTKKEKKKRPYASVAIVAALCVVLSGFAAFGGTYLAGRINAAHQRNNASVIYKSVYNEGGTISNTDSTFGTPGTYAEVAAKVSGSVVEIRTEKVSTSSIFSQYITTGAGSGVVITADGYVITNNHVIEGASTVTVTTTDGTKYPAEVIGFDAESDLAVLKVEAENLTPAVVGDSTKLVVGEEVIAIGNPLGSLGGTVTNGIISALARQVTIDGTQMTLLQTNAAVNPGNSGGGLFNLAGELIGIVNAKSSGSGIEGLGFAIPSNMASQVVEQLINYGYVRGRVSLGITYMDISDSYTAMMYRVNTLGVYILESEHNENLKIGDRVTAVDGVEVTYGKDIKAALKDHKVGDKITLTVVRDGKYVDVEMECFEYIPGESKEDTDKTEEKSVGGLFDSPFSSWFGF